MKIGVRLLKIVCLKFERSNLGFFLNLAAPIAIINHHNAAKLGIANLFQRAILFSECLKSIQLWGDILVFFIVASVICIDLSNLIQGRF
jgi:hypothetical protein